MPEFPGVLSNFDEIDTYFAQLVAGRLYYVELEGIDTGAGTLDDPSLSVFFGGNFVAEDDDGGVGLNSRAVFRASTTGNYVFAVSEFDGNPGSYVLRVNEDDFRGTAEGEGVVGAVGNRLLAQQGIINYAGDKDGFSTQLIAGLAYTITETGSATLRPHVTVVDGDDNLVASSPAAGGRSISMAYTPSLTGAYLVQAGSQSSETGAYSITVSVGRGTNNSEEIIGTAFSDNIQGQGGNDEIFGNVGLDRLVGGNGSDFLDGGSGGDYLIGGLGNDRYVSDNPNDVIVEAVNEGIDTMFITASRTLAANVENLTLIGTTATWAFGNNLANVIRGNVLENSLVGGAGDDWIDGGLGSDRITGGAGLDHLVGESGIDTFVFTESTGRDFIHAFESGVDRVNVAAIDANPSALGDQAFVFVGGASFSGRFGELRYDGTDLSGDINGDAVADFSVTIANHVPISQFDLIV